MLVLTRKLDEAIVIDGNITVRVVGIKKNGNVRLGITAPANMRVDREELRQKYAAKAETPQQ